MTNEILIHVFSMTSKLEAGNTLSRFIQNIGIPDVIVVNEAGKQTGKNTKFVKACNHFKIQQRQMEPHTPSQNRAEAAIGKVEKQWRDQMCSKGVPKQLWNNGLVLALEINNQMARGPEARAPWEEITGNTLDITKWLDFNFCNWCWFWQGPTHKLIESKAEFEKVLGVSYQISSDLCYWVLMESGTVIARTTIQRMIKEDLLLPHVKLKMCKFEDKIKPKMDDQRHRVDSLAEGLTTEDEEDLNDEPEEEAKPEQDKLTKEMYDAYIGAMLLIPSGDKIVGRVMKQVRDGDGNPLGQRNSNPILDTSIYKVQFGDGSMVKYDTNLVAKNVMGQSDPEGTAT